MIVLITLTNVKHAIQIRLTRGQPVPAKGEHIWIRNPDGSSNNWMVKVNEIHHNWAPVFGEARDPNAGDVELFCSFETTAES